MIAPDQPTPTPATGTPRPITPEDVIREANKSYDIGLRHGREERDVTIEGLRAQLAHLTTELEQARRERDEAKSNGIVLNAWQQAFGTTQLSHAIIRLETEERMRRKMESAHGEVLSECVHLRAQLATSESSLAKLTAELGEAKRDSELLDKLNAYLWRGKTFRRLATSPSMVRFALLRATPQNGPGEYVDSEGRTLRELARKLIHDSDD